MPKCVVDIIKFGVGTRLVIIKILFLQMDIVLIPNEQII